MAKGTLIRRCEGGRSWWPCATRGPSWPRGARRNGASRRACIPTSPRKAKALLDAAAIGAQPTVDFPYAMSNAIVNAMGGGTRQ